MINSDYNPIQSVNLNRMKTKDQAEIIYYEPLRYVAMNQDAAIFTKLSPFSIETLCKIDKYLRNNQLG